MGWQDQSVISAVYVIVGGATGGVFVYSGSPATGNLVSSDAGLAGTDSFDNHYLGGGSAWYGATSAIAIQSGTTIQRYTGSLAAGWVPAAAAIDFASNTQVEINGALIATSGTLANPSVIITDPGATMILQNGWTAGGGGPVPQYALLASPAHSVEVIGRLIAPAGIAVNQVIWNMPAGYVPSDTQSILARNVTTNAIVMLRVNSAGDIDYQAGAAAGDAIDFHAIYSLVA